MNPAIHPGAEEICNDGIDNNCDLLVDGADPLCMFDDFGDASGCGCTLAGGAAPAPALVIAAILALALRGRRR